MTETENLDILWTAYEPTARAAESQATQITEDNQESA